MNLLLRPRFFPFLLDTWTLNGLRIKKNIIGIKKIYPKGSKKYYCYQKNTPRNLYPHQPLSAPHHFVHNCAPIALIANSDADTNASVAGLLCTYVGLSALKCGCMHARARACISVCMSACTYVLKQHSSTGRSYFCLKAWSLGRQHKVATQDVAVRFKHAHRCACCGLSSAKQIYSWGREGMAVPYLCVKAQTSRRQQKDCRLRM